MKLILRTLIIGLAVGCTPAVTLPPIASEGINASFGKTWDAVIDGLSEGNVPVKTLDKASGYITVEVADAGSSEAEYASKLGKDALADCGPKLVRYPMLARYNIVVRGDSTTSTVRVRAQFSENGWDCPSRNTFETKLQSYVKAKAEGR